MKYVLYVLLCVLYANIHNNIIHMFHKPTFLKLFNLEYAVSASPAVAKKEYIESGTTLTKYTDTTAKFMSRPSKGPAPEQNWSQDVSIMSVPKRALLPMEVDTSRTGTVNWTNIHI